MPAMCSAAPRPRKMCYFTRRLALFSSPIDSQPCGMRGHRHTFPVVLGSPLVETFAVLVSHPPVLGDAGRSPIRWSELPEMPVRMGEVAVSETVQGRPAAVTVVRAVALIRR